MALFQDENSSDPLKITRVGEGEKSQQRSWPTPSAPAFLTKPTQGADDQLHDKNENEVDQPEKRSMLWKVKDKAKTFIHKHGYGHSSDNKEEEDHHQIEEKQDHDNFEQEGKEDTEEKKEKAEDLNSNFSTRSSDAGSAVSPGLDVLSSPNLSNDSEAASDREVTKPGFQRTPSDPNVVAEGFEQRAASDRPPSPAETARAQPELLADPADAGSAVSPGFDALSTPNLSNESETVRDREVTKTGIQWTPRDPNVVAEDFEPRAASDRPPSPVETARVEPELLTATGQPSAGISPILQSPEAENIARPYGDVQSDSYSNEYMTHQVDDLDGTDTAISTPRVPATHPVQNELSPEQPNLVPYKGNEDLENEMYGKDESENIDYSEPFARSPRAPEGMMKPITEEPAVETIPIQRAAEDRWFDADDVVAGAPIVKDQNPSVKNIGSEEFGSTEPISDDLEYADQDKLGATEIKRHGAIVGAPSVKDQNASVTDVESEDFGLTEPISDDIEYAGQDKLGGTEIKSHGGVSDESLDLRGQEDENFGRSESAGLEAAPSLEGSKDTTTMDVGGTDLHASEKEKERKYEESAGDDESYMDKSNGMASTETIANAASRLGDGEHQSVDEAPYEPEKMAEKDYSDNSEKGKSYGDENYETDSREKNEISSQPRYDEHQEPEQEIEKRTERPSADEEEETHEERGESLTDTPSGAESVVSSNNAVEEKAGGQKMEKYEDDDDKKTESDTGAGKGKGYTGMMFSTASTAKNALFSTFGFGAAKPVEDEQIHPTERKE